MFSSKIPSLAIVLCLVGVLKAHPYGYGRPRPYMPPQYYGGYNSGTDLETLLQLAKFIGENNKEVPHDITHGLNIEQIIMKLLNALIYTCTQNNGHRYNGHGGKSSESLVDLRLLNSGRNNVADLNVGGKDVLGVGVGGGNGKGGKKGKEQEAPLVDVNLLQPGDNNVAEVDVAGKDVLGVGLGGEKEHE